MPDALDEVIVHTDMDELLEAAVSPDDPKCAVASAHQLTCGFDDPSEHDRKFQVVRDRPGHGASSGLSARPGGTDARSRRTAVDPSWA